MLSLERRWHVGIEEASNDSSGQAAPKIRQSRSIGIRLEGADGFDFVEVPVTHSPGCFSDVVSRVVVVCPVDEHPVRTPLTHFNRTSPTRAPADWFGSAHVWRLDQLAVRNRVRRAVAPHSIKHTDRGESGCQSMADPIRPINPSVCPSHDQRVTLLMGRASVPDYGTLAPVSSSGSASWRLR